MAIVKNGPPVYISFFIPGTQTINTPWLEWFNSIDSETGGVGGLGDLSTLNQTDLGDLAFLDQEDLGGVATVESSDLAGQGLTSNTENKIDFDFEPIDSATPNYLDEVVFNDVSETIEEDALPSVLGRAAIEDIMLAGGGVLQIASSSSTAYGDITTVLPVDNTIPQSSEGVEIMSVSITPRSSASTIYISADCYGYQSSANAVSMALFQDSAANAIAASFIDLGSGLVHLNLRHPVTGLTAGTSYTFKIRAGPTAGTFKFLQTAGGSVYGGSLARANIWAVEHLGGTFT